ncbi:tyrosine--tRNA ligase [Mycoplasmoides genitalium]|uniref:tyrosine--tRNA ligase n=1 Tax=Mycoplasmoides genitalium TaxID=2097 RepID=UPI002FCE3767
MLNNILQFLKERELYSQANFETELDNHLKEKKINFYVGFDPTANSLHIGNYVLIHIAKLLKDMRHTPHIVLGSATALIGDPTGRIELRKILEEKEIVKNTKTIKQQIKQFLGDVIIHENKVWLEKLNYIEVIRELGAFFSVNKMLSTDAFSVRWEKGLTLMELNYMILQAYDFYYLHKNHNVTLQIGGSDQWANILAGANLIKRKNNANVFGLTANLLVKANGEKMGKTSSGALWLDENKTSVFDFYQYWINLDDQSLKKTFLMLTMLDKKVIDELCNLKGPKIKQTKQMLAFLITELVHGTKKAKEAQQRSELIFSNQPDLDIKLVKTSTNLIDYLVETKFIKSKSEARRLISQKGLTINNKHVLDLNQIIEWKEELQIIRKGKKSFLTIKAVNS